jgi:hypothetical protein
MQSASIGATATTQKVDKAMLAVRRGLRSHKKEIIPEHTPNIPPKIRPKKSSL